MRYFNSRPSARGDWRNGNTYCRFGISIHAPPRGATRFLGDGTALPCHFNSRPSARGDTQASHRIPPDENFNSRPSARGDMVGVQFWQIGDISIHAPPRGATCRTSASAERRTNFNSRPSARGDERQEWLNALTIYFNSRPSARGDTQEAIRQQRTSKFQFTPLREGRPSRRWSARKQSGFQFTPLREGRLVAVCERANDLISIHAPPRGATAKDMQFLQIFCSTLTNQHGLTIVPGNLSRLFW